MAPPRSRLRGGRPISGDVAAAIDAAQRSAEEARKKMEELMKRIEELRKEAEARKDASVWKVIGTFFLGAVVGTLLTGVIVGVNTLPQDALKPKRKDD